MYLLYELPSAYSDIIKSVTGGDQELMRFVRVFSIVIEPVL